MSTATVYRARRGDDGAPLCDWKIVDTSKPTDGSELLGALTAAFAEGWKPTEAEALAALPPVASPVAPPPEPVDVFPDILSDPDGVPPAPIDEPASAPTKKASKKK